ncbi:hypothetical protein PIB30_005805 [Stylosanthes scabra]|uniref:FLZ-type domain-containing protein n=1 Tax=Stylosanthes scabra TaxID=79078 RepID=A0ABU6Y5T1_9FABA|nr:hypothetical protein [Stylosanthes scabra]
MMLGKRGRPPMKRTTSMSEITFDLSTDPKHPHLHHPPPPPLTPPPPSTSDQSRMILSTVSPRNNHHHRRQISVDSEQQPSDFLFACSLCKRRLVPGRDIYMYRGDSGFCSQECREQQMKQDEKRKDKCCGVASAKKQVAVTTAPSSGSQLATTY